MTTQQAEIIIQQCGVAIALQHRFAFDSGTLLRLEDYSMVNIFDDGRYFIQGGSAEMILAFTEAEAPWDPNAWNGEMPRQAIGALLPFSTPTAPPKP